MAAVMAGGVRVASVAHFLEHQYTRFRSTWVPTIVNALASPVFFLLTIGFGLGSQVDTTTLPTDDYAAYVGAGVLASVMMMQGVSYSLWPTLGALKWEGTYKAVLATPLTPVELATGHIAWIGFRAMIAGVLYVLVLVAFGIVATPLAVLAPVAGAVTAMAFAAPLSAFSATRETDASFALVQRVGVTPLFLFSGAFFPVSQLPDSVAWFARLTPVWHGVELCRGLILGGSSAGSMLGHLGVQLLFVVGGWLLAGRTFTARLAA